MYEKLFEPVWIRGMKLKNRFVMVAMDTHSAARDGSTTPKINAFFAERARGGTGLVFPGAAFIDHEGSRFSWGQLSAADDSYITELNQIAEAIKFNGAKAGLQICHAGRQNFTAQPPLYAPSAIPWEAVGVVPEELTLERIEQIIESFGRAAKRAKTAGFDCVEVHGAHGYLITSFMSPLFNRRTDLYGGSFERRMRFPVEVVQRIKQKCGEGFPLFFRLSGSEYLEGGYTLEDAKLIAKRLVEAGVDCLNVSAAVHDTMQYQVPPYHIPAGCNVPLAAGIKSVVDVPVIAAGAINTPEIALEAVASGKADLIGMARPLMADPFFVKKLQQGRVEDINRCIRCNEGCVRRSGLELETRCDVNAEAGRELEFRLVPATRPRFVLVAGGGPAGMEAARIASLRGHRVMLCEKESELGGALGVASFPGYKREIGYLKQYLTTQVNKLPIKIRTGVEVTRELVEEVGPDVAVVATGATPYLPRVPGIDGDNVCLCTDLFHEVPKKRSVDQLGERVAVVGAGIIGIETATWLRQLGKDVAVALTTRRPKEDIGSSMEVSGRLVMMDWLKDPAIKVYTDVNLTAVHPDGITLMDKNWRSRKIAVDSVVLASGYEPDRRLSDSLQSLGLEVLEVGDCVEPRQIGQAVFEGAWAARQI